MPPYAIPSVAFRTRLCDLLGIEVPIVGAGTGSIATAELAAAVTNAGGFGMTGAAGDSPEAVIERLRAIRALTDGPVGVNVILEVQPPEAVRAILEDGIDVLATGWGEPTPWVEVAHGLGAKVFHRCESPAEAAAAAAAGVDVVIAQGSDAGGHTGRVPTFALVPQVVDAAEGVPVLAAGGIADGRGLVAALALGADGVLIGTRLVAAEESGAHEEYKRRVVAADATDSVLTDVFEIGWPGLPERALRNATIDAWEAEPEPRVRPSDRPVEVIGVRPLEDGELEIPRWWVDTPHAGDRGAVEEMALYAGPAAGLVREVLPAAEIVRRIAAEAEDAWASLERARGGDAGRLSRDPR
jgi:NAD(P)H-dependent flavin oxidoreductase YrpB (nitropropane dioxygenase family)